MENTDNLENAIPCKLKIPRDVHSKAPVCLVNFSNGAINLNNSGKLSFKSLRPAEDEPTDSSAARRALIANNGRLNYQSDVVSNNNNPDEIKTRYYVGVRKKGSSKMTVYDSLIFHLRPVLNTDIKPSPSTAQAKNVREKLTDLTTSFGSKDMKRSLNAREKYGTNTVPLERTFDDLLLDDSFKNADSISMPKTSSSIEYIPSQNCDAKFRDEVYRISDIIPAEIDHFLRVLADKVIRELSTCFPQWKSEKTYCEFVLSHFERALSKDNNYQLDEVKVQYMIYYNFLVAFSHSSATDMKKKDPAPNIPEPIKSIILETFTISSENENGRMIRKFSPLMKDKLLAYILVLALLIDDYLINLSIVCDDVKCSMPKVISVTQALGCYVTHNAPYYMAELRLPLFVPSKYYRKF